MIAVLLNRDRLRQIPRLVPIRAFGDGTDVFVRINDLPVRRLDELLH
jgi:hypothetical protein